MRLNLLLKGQLKKQQKQLVTWLVVKFLIKLWKKVSKSLQQNDSGTITKGNGKEIPKERYISPEERQEIINELRLK